MDVIAIEIKENAEGILRAAGILLVVARVVNFKFPGKDERVNEILNQQLATWSSEWERKSAKVLAEAKAVSEHTQQEARAYAEALLLNSIADGLQQTQRVDRHLTKYVIARRFLSSLEDLVHKQSDEEEQDKNIEPNEEKKKKEEYKKKIENLGNHFKEWQDLFFPNQDKE